MTEQTNPQFEGNPESLAATAGEGQAQLQLADLLLAAQAIQLASQRGAFRVDEFSQVGGAYERIVAFLQANNAIRQVTPEEAAAANTAASAPLTGTPAAQ